MASARDNNAVNMDLEEGLAAASQPSNNHSSAPSDDDGAFNHHAPTATAADRPGAAPELAASAATAAVTATNNVRAGLELVDDASDLPLPIGMVEAGLASEEGGTANAKNISNDASSIVAKVLMFKDAMRRRQLELETLQGHLSLPSSMGLGATNSAAAPPSGLEVMDDNDGLPAPIGIHEGGNRDEGKKRGEVELISDDVGPDPPAALIEQTLAKTNFHPSNLGGRDSIIVPTREEMEEDNLPLTTTSRGDRRGGGLTPSANGQMDTDSNSIADENTVDTGGVNDAGLIPDLERSTTTASDLGQDRETQIITEAYRVEERSEDGIVIVGEPLLPPLPWWKQRKAKLCFGAVTALFVMLAISLGVPLLRKEPATTITNVILATNSPSQSYAPSFQPSGYSTRKPSTAPSTTTSPSDHPSDSPSASLIPTAVPSIKPSVTPSYSPSACVDQISSNAQKIDLPLDGPSDTMVAVDGKDMVIVLGGWGGPVFVIFYTLANGGWQKVKTFQEDGVGTHRSVGLSGSTAFVGFRNANDYGGGVSVYEKNQYGDWDLVEDPFIHYTNTTFGAYVDIDGNLACVGAHLFRRETNKWVQFDSIINGERCSIAGGTIVTTGWDSELGQYSLQLYKYNQKLDEVFPIQDPISTTREIFSLDLSQDYLVYSHEYELDVFMYRWEETNQTYTFHQQLNIFSGALTLDNDILAVASFGKAHIFSQQSDGKWEETFTLDLPNYNRLLFLSGRGLFATTSYYEVFYFNIEGCSQAMPTQTPSFSKAPTDSPTSSPSKIPSSSPTLVPSSSSSPSMSSSPTLSPSSSSSSSPSMTPSSTTAPSSSSSPTLLQCIEIAITHDWYPWGTSWKLERVVGGFWDRELIKRHQGSEGDTSYFESICLRDAEYIFTIRDWGGICCDNGEGNYNVTSNGMLIVRGGEWNGESKSTYFSIPFIPSS